MKKTLVSALCTALLMSACGSPDAEESYLEGQGFDSGQVLSSNKGGKYPLNPETSVTPGDLCEHPDELRYPEKIKYCERHVSSGTKDEIIQMYDKKFGYAVAAMRRGDFKIDHFIPLCMGGSNDVENLWPQHKTVYSVTDPFEPRLCDLMKAGRMKQAEAMNYIKKVKFNLDAADGIMNEIEAKTGVSFAE